MFTAASDGLWSVTSARASVLVVSRATSLTKLPLVMHALRRVPVQSCRGAWARRAVRSRARRGRIVDALERPVDTQPVADDVVQDRVERRVGGPHPGPDLGVIPVAFARVDVHAADDGARVS